MLMGVGNLTELTDVDSAGVNTLLDRLLPGAGRRQRPDDRRDQLGPVVGPRDRPGPPAGLSCRDAAGRSPSTSSPAWSCSATPRSPRFGPEALAELAAPDQGPQLADLRRGRADLRHEQRPLPRRAPTRSSSSSRWASTDPSHAFYLGYELMKAKTALTLNKAYRQDQALDWGFLTEPEVSHRDRKKRPRPREGPP